ncbi:TolB-like 6-blade propeller-like [Tangfeifania diversioriginum]|uniref:TolB-like 6-blade propeller-like n=1 Tax=Tangfeifania diversioriginum TaxID=1168035 RepID=A0A1M6NT97_9BACT|nr:BF3164 family lipoprotein [Tangfeifania diversioriginum]SHJ98874.1 TolB-like 6-blade propeller-like [Tangfeifania diversioriginum]
MKKTVTLILIFFVFHFIVSAQKEVRFDLDDFPKTEALKGERITFDPPLMDPWKMELADSLLFLLGSGTEKAVDVYNLHTRKKMTQFCRRGRGPGEMIFPFLIQYIQNSDDAVVHDLNGKKVIIYSLKKILAKNPNNYSKVVNVDSLYPRKLVKISGDRFFVTLIGHPDAYMNCLFDMDGNVVKMLNKFPDPGMENNNTLASNLYQTNISASPDLSKVILSYAYWRWIEIFNDRGECITKFIGPDFTVPDFVRRKNGLILTSRNSVAYCYAATNNDSFIIPFSGEKAKMGGSNFYKYALHLGYDGELICKYTFDPVVSDIQIDWKNRIIYGLNKELEPVVYKYHF